MHHLLLVIKYIYYWVRSKNAHGIHSPFVFELYNECIKKQINYYSFDKIELLRNKLLSLKNEIFVTDLGTGKSKKRKIRDVARRSAKNKKYGQLLFRIAHDFKPSVILELGTSLGLSTCYLASSNPITRVLTIEGCANIANEAKENFKTIGLINIESIIGDFATELPSIINTISPKGSLLVFFDGNHRKEPTLDYFNQCLKIANQDSIFIFDDIHWSSEMEEAWEEIKGNERVTVTVDLFYLGLVFFRKEQAKENFRLRF